MYNLVFYLIFYFQTSILCNSARYIPFTICSSLCALRGYLFGSVIFWLVFVSLSMGSLCLVLVI